MIRILALVAALVCADDVTRGNEALHGPNDTSIGLKAESLSLLCYAICEPIWMRFFAFDAALTDVHADTEFDAFDQVLCTVFCFTQSL